MPKYAVTIQLGDVEAENGYQATQLVLKSIARLKVAKAQKWGVEMTSAIDMKEMYGDLDDDNERLDNPAEISMERAHDRAAESASWKPCTNVDHNNITCMAAKLPREEWCEGCLATFPAPEAPEIATAVAAQTGDALNEWGMRFIYDLGLVVAGSDDGRLEGSEMLDPDFAEAWEQGNQKAVMDWITNHHDLNSQQIAWLNVALESMAEEHNWHEGR